MQLVGDVKFSQDDNNTRDAPAKKPIAVRARAKPTILLYKHFLVSFCLFFSPPFLRRAFPERKGGYFNFSLKKSIVRFQASSAEALS
jgi:hypothetical protein